MNKPTPTSDAARLAATILLLRDGPEGLEVFMVLRHQQIDFASGALVFPGGKLAQGDWSAREFCDGAEGLDEQALALRVGAIREAFEESGVLLARRTGSKALLSGDELGDLGERYRRSLDAGDVGIAEMARREGLRLACDGLTPFAHWVTPAFMPKRFDTLFFLARAPSTQLAGHDDHEVVDSEWVRPDAVLAQVQAGQRTMVPATRVNVEKLGRSRTVDEAFDAALASEVVRVEPQMVGREGNTVTLSIPSEAGYGLTEFSFSVGA